MKNIYLNYLNIKKLDGYHRNIYYSYKICIEFPHIYDYTKDINLDRIGVLHINDSDWKYLYDILKLYGNLDFIKGKYNPKSVSEINKEIIEFYKNQGIAPHLLLFSRIVGYISFINRRFIFECNILNVAEGLYNFFLFNTDIYERSLKNVDIGEIIKDNLVKGRFDKHPDIEKSLRYQMFINDLKSRV